MTMSGWKSRMQRRQASSSTRLYSRLRGAPSSFTRPASRDTSWPPRKPEPPVTTTRLSAQKSIRPSEPPPRAARASRLGIRELLLPAQHVGRLDQLVDPRRHVDLGLEPLASNLGVGDLVVPLILVSADVGKMQVVVDLLLDQERDVFLAVVHLLGSDVVHLVPHRGPMVEGQRERAGDVPDVDERPLEGALVDDQALADPRLVDEVVDQQVEPHAV